MAGDEVAAAQGAVGVAVAPQEDDRVRMSLKGEDTGQLQKRGYAGGVVVGPLSGTRR